MRRINRFLIITVLSLLFVSGIFPNGLSLNGVGSRASAMGTAYIGLSDDLYEGMHSLGVISDDKITCYITIDGVFYFNTIGIIIMYFVFCDQYII